MDRKNIHRIVLKFTSDCKQVMCDLYITDNIIWNFRMDNGPYMTTSSLLMVAGLTRKQCIPLFSTMAFSGVNNAFQWVLFTGTERCHYWFFYTCGRVLNNLSSIIWSSDKVCQQKSTVNCWSKIIAMLQPRKATQNLKRIVLRLLPVEKCTPFETI